MDNSRASNFPQLWRGLVGCQRAAIYPKFLCGFAEDPLSITQAERPKEKHRDFTGMWDVHGGLQGRTEMTL